MNHDPVPKPPLGKIRRAVLVITDESGRQYFTNSEENLFDALLRLSPCEVSVVLMTDDEYERIPATELSYKVFSPA